MRQVDKHQMRLAHVMKRRAWDLAIKLQTVDGGGGRARTAQN